MLLAHMATASSPNIDDLFFALAHPLRRQILRKMIAKDGETSPCELSVELDQPLSRLGYHVKILAQSGAIELVRTRQRRGATQHLYRSALKATWAHAALR